MKFTTFVLWYFFIIYSASVLINYSHFNEVFSKNSYGSFILNSSKCIFKIDEDPTNCKFSFNLKKETVLYFLKEIVNKKEFARTLRLTMRKDSKKKNEEININIDLKSLQSDENSEKYYYYWYTIYFLISIAFLTFITPLWSLNNHIYFITVIFIFLISLFFLLWFVKLAVFLFIYLITFTKYKFWLLPNLNKDLGVFCSFWPLYELNKNQSFINENFKPTIHENSLNDKIETDKKDTENNLKNDIVNNTEINEQNITENFTITEFPGTDFLPKITTTPPIEKIKSKSSLELVDLNNYDDGDSDNEDVYDTNNDENNYYNDDFAKITPAVSYLNVNEIRRKNNLPARQRIASNRSDDGFEILNDLDFLKRNNQFNQETDLVCLK